MLDQRTTPRVRRDLLTEDFAGELVILDPVSGALHHLDRRSSTVWRLLGSGAAVGEAIEAVVGATGAGRKRVTTDVVALVEQLLELGLLLHDARAS